VRDVPDFPKPGILFRDITPLLADAEAFRQVIEALAAEIAPHRPEGLVAIESRGFVFGAALAQQMRLPLLLVRKPGKLPWQTVHVEYQLEYGSDRLEMHRDAVRPGGRYALIDDVLATGGTAAAACTLVEQQAGRLACCAFLLELEALGGRDRLAGQEIASLLRY
jgi:adenine phosphoribosyltransferase (EC 2.4.2.7)